MYKEIKNSVGKERERVRQRETETDRDRQTDRQRQAERAGGRPKAETPNDLTLCLGCYSHVH